MHGPTRRVARIGAGGRCVRSEDAGLGADRRRADAHDQRGRVRDHGSRQRAGDRRRRPVVDHPGPGPRRPAGAVRRDGRPPGRRGRQRAGPRVAAAVAPRRGQRSHPRAARAGHPRRQPQRQGRRPDPQPPRDGRDPDRGPGPRRRRLRRRGRRLARLPAPPGPAPPDHPRPEPGPDADRPRHADRRGGPAVAAAEHHPPGGRAARRRPGRDRAARAALGRPAAACAPTASAARCPTTSSGDPPGRGSSDRVRADDRAGQRPRRERQPDRDRRRHRRRRPRSARRLRDRDLDLRGPQGVRGDDRRPPGDRARGPRRGPGHLGAGADDRGRDPAGYTQATRGDPAGDPAGDPPRRTTARPAEASWEGEATPIERGEARRRRPRASRVDDTAPVGVGAGDATAPVARDGRRAGWRSGSRGWPAWSRSPSGCRDGP